MAFSHLRERGSLVRRDADALGSVASFRDLCHTKYLSRNICNKYLRHMNKLRPSTLTNGQRFLLLISGRASN
jgi:hypothetical protein